MQYRMQLPQHDDKQTIWTKGKQSTTCLDVDIDDEIQQQIRALLTAHVQESFALVSTTVSGSTSAATHDGVLNASTLEVLQMQAASAQRTEQSGIASSSQAGTTN